MALPIWVMQDSRSPLDQEISSLSSTHSLRLLLTGSTGQMPDIFGVIVLSTKGGKETVRKVCPEERGVENKMKKERP